MNKHVTLTTLFYLLTACGSNSTFGGQGLDSVAHPQQTEDVQGRQQPDKDEETVDGTFRLLYPANPNVDPVDLVFTVDNSSSMNEEAAHVRKNIANFLDAVSGYTTTKLALISASEQMNPNTGVTLPQELLQKGHLQIFNSVASTNHLAIAAVASCEASLTNLNAPLPKFCGNRPTTDYIEEKSYVTSARGQLMSFLRPEAKRVYIFVTDDVPSGFTAQDFFNTVRAENDYLVYAFRGQKDASCVVTSVDDSFDWLAQTTKGKTFDVCAQDWTAPFAEISNHIREAIDPGYVLPDNIQILKIIVDGVEIKNEDYRIDGSTLKFSGTVKISPTSQIEVIYKK